MKLERIHERALRFVNDDFDLTYVDGQAKANISSLHIRRLKNGVIVDGHGCHTEIVTEYDQEIPQS